MVFENGIICLRILLLILCFHHITKCENLSILDQTAFVIMSQKAHGTLASQTKLKLGCSLETFGVNNPQIILLHEDLPILGGWSIIPILKPLLAKYPEGTEWFIFLNENGSINPDILEMVLNESDIKNDVFIGRALQDQHPVIIHFYNDNLDMKYPDFSAGFALSRSIAYRLLIEFQRSTDVPASKKVESQKYTTHNMN